MRQTLAHVDDWWGTWHKPNKPPASHVTEGLLQDPLAPTNIPRPQAFFSFFNLIRIKTCKQNVSVLQTHFCAPQLATCPDQAQPGIHQTHHILTIKTNADESTDAEHGHDACVIECIIPKVQTQSNYNPKLAE